MKTTLPALALCTLLAGCGDVRQPLDPLAPDGPVEAAFTFTQNDLVPIDIAIFIPCAAGGAGEVVVLSGTLHLLFHVTENANGFHVKTHAQPQQLSGTGQVTGDTYQGTGVTQDQQNVAAGETITFVNNFRIIGQGPGNNFLVHQNVHVTVNANGEITTVVDNTSIDCK